MNIASNASYLEDILGDPVPTYQSMHASAWTVFGDDPELAMD